MLEPSSPTQTNVTSENGIYRAIPNTFFVTQQGVAWYLQPNSIFSETGQVYQGNLIIGRGEIYNEDIGFTVNQNTPNPATDITRILVTSEDKDNILLTVTNILGQVIHKQTAFNSALGHTFSVNVSNFNSGFYFYTVQVGNKSVTNKMLVK